jgi:hypothetical protein
MINIKDVSGKGLLKQMVVAGNGREAKRSEGTDDFI